MGYPMRITVFRIEGTVTQRKNGVHAHLVLGDHHIHRLLIGDEVDANMQADKNGYWRLMFVFQLWLFFQ